MIILFILIAGIILFFLYKLYKKVNTPISFQTPDPIKKPKMEEISNQSNPPELMMDGFHGGEKIHTTNTKERMLIPEGLSEIEKQILIDFYDL